MRKVAILMICLLSSSCADNIANNQSFAANAAPPNYRAQVVRQMTQAYEVKRIREAGITPPVFKFVSVVHGTRWVVCVATFEDATIIGTLYRVTIITFNNGQAEILSDSFVNAKGSASRIKLLVSGPCQGLTTSPMPEIVRGKPLS